MPCHAMPLYLMLLQGRVCLDSLSLINSRGNKNVLKLKKFAGVLPLCHPLKFLKYNKYLPHVLFLFNL